MPACGGELLVVTKDWVPLLSLESPSVLEVDCEALEVVLMSLLVASFWDFDVEGKGSDWFTVSTGSCLESVVVVGEIEDSERV